MIGILTHIFSIRPLNLIFALALILLLPAFSSKGQELNDYEEEEETREYIVKKYLHFGAGTGFLTLFGELDNDINPSVPERLGGQLFFNYGVTPSFTLGVAFTTGSLFGQIRSDSTSEIFANMNVKTPVFAPQIRASYNFGGLYKSGIPGVFQPWIYTGIEAVFFNPLGDMATAEGKQYHYWKDGEIRDLPETPENAGQAEFIQRDYFYETVLRDADLDGLGRYPIATLSIPFGVGLDINLNKNLSLTIGTSYHFTFTDYLDNITHKSGQLDPTRAFGNKRPDAFMLVHAGITFKYYDYRPVKSSSIIIPPAAQLPYDFVPFDINQDNIIQKEEVIKAINDLFNGDSEYDPELIGLLVDFYNVQRTTRERIRY